MTFAFPLKRWSARLSRGIAHAPLLSALAIAVPVQFAVHTAQAQTQEAVAPLDLKTALQRALEADPGLRAASAGIDAAQGGLRQAKVRPNPTLSAEVENFSGRGDLRGFSGAESTYSLSQELEAGGKRKARIDLADRELHGAELDHVLRGLDLIREVQGVYFEALAAEELAGIARERLRTAEALNTSISRRVQAARDPLMAGARAEAGLAEARIASSRADAEAGAARSRLASYWGGGDAIALNQTSFTLPASIDHDHSLDDTANPDLARLATQRDRQAAAVRVERSLAYANPTLTFGYRRFEDRNGDGALVAGISIPLGVFDRNQGAAARARAEERKAGYDREATRLAIVREVATLQRALANDSAAARATERDVIPQAERALGLARDGYNRGAFSYLDVLEAQRALSDAREKRVAALRAYHANEAALDRLTARFSDMVPGEEIHK